MRGEVDSFILSSKSCKYMQYILKLGNLARDQQITETHRKYTNLEQAEEPSAHSAGKRGSAGMQTREHAECGNAGEHGQVWKVQAGVEGVGKQLKTINIAVSGQGESRCINVFAGCMCEDLGLVVVLEELEDRLDAHDKGVIPHDSGDA